ncbi:MAG: TRAP transporter small permease [Desulfovibrionaceae bacterium]
MNNGTRHETWGAAFDRVLVTWMRRVCVVCFSLLLLLLAGNVFVRYVPVVAFYWFDEVVEFLFAWMVFIGAAALWARDEHFKLEWFRAKLVERKHGHLAVAVLECVSLAFLIVFFTQALRLTCLAKDWTPVFNAPRYVVYACMPFSGLVMCGYSVRAILRELRAWRAAGREDGHAA